MQILLVLGCMRTASAQITSATISSTIRDQTGTALPGVDVTVRNLETGVTRVAVSGDDGSYSIPGLPPGSYEARATLQGFATALKGGMVLAVGQHASLTLTMHVAPASR
jgi:Carboxypeptidase regulatory-like domain